MIHPSYVDLMQVVNRGVEEGEEPVISSRYSIVMATARRARQLVAGDDPLVEHTEGRKALSVAVEELNEDKIKILTEAEKAEMEERMAQEARNARKAAQEGAEGADQAEAAQEEMITLDGEAEAEPAAEEAADQTGEAALTDEEG